MIKKHTRIFDVEDSAGFLGVHPNMIYRYAMAGRLIPLHQGKQRKRGDQLFFSLKDLKAFKRPKKGRPSNPIKGVRVMLKAELIEMLDDVSDIIENDDLSDSEKVEQISDIVIEDEEGEEE
jgi:hypothetical protein